MQLIITKRQTIHWLLNLEQSHLMVQVLLFIMWLQACHLTVYFEPSNRDFRLDCKREINLHCKYNDFFKILLQRCWQFKILLTRCWNWSLSDEYVNVIIILESWNEEININKILASEDATYSIQLQKESVEKSGLILPARCWIFKI